MHRPSFVAAKVDSIHFYKEQINGCRLAIEHQLKLPTTPTRIGFVTFSSVILAMQASQTLHDKNPHKMIVEPAPAPNDIHWNWIIVPKPELLVRSIFVYII
jgi:hypothetical protein